MDSRRASPHKVFLSSTFQENAELRLRLSQIVIDLGMEPVALEWRGADPKHSVDYVLEQVRSADVVVGILGHRYGTIPAGHEHSFTELELDAATEKLVFIVSENALIDPRERDSGELDKRQCKERLLEDLKERMMLEATTSHFHPDGLLELVRVSLQRWRDARDGGSRPLRPGHGSPLHQPQEALVGRRNELKILRTAFEKFRAGETPVFYGINGPGGVGKTRLAREFVDSIAAGTKVYFGDAAGGSIETAIITAQDSADPGDSEERRSFATSSLRGLPDGCVLVLDGVGRWDATPLSAISKRVFVLLMTQLVDPPSPVIIQWLSLRDLDPDAVIRFLQNRGVPAGIAQRAAPALEERGLCSPFWLNATCRVLQHFVKSGGSADVGRALNDILEEIGSYEERERVFRIAFDVLSREKATNRLLLALASFAPGEIDYDRLASIAGVELESERSRSLDALRSWGFLEADGAEGDGNRLHAIVQRFLAGRLARSPETDRRELRDRFATHWLSLLAEGDEARVWRNHLNLVRAIDIVSREAAGERFRKEIGKLGPRQFRVVSASIPPGPALQFYLAVLLHQTDPPTTASLYLRIAEAFQRRRQLRKAEDFTQASIGIFERTSDWQGRVEALKRLGYIYGRLQQTPAAEAALTAAFKVHEAAGDVLQGANVLRTLAQALLRAGDVEGAFDRADRAVQRLESLDESTYEVVTALAYALSMRGRVYVALDRTEAALDDLRRARELHESQVGPSHYYVAYDLLALARAKLRSPDLAAALADLEAARDIYLAFFGPSVQVATVNLEIAAALLQSEAPGDDVLARAQANIDEAEAALARVPGLDGKTSSRAVLLRARLEQRLGRAPEALAEARRAVRILDGTPGQERSRHMVEAQLVAAELELASAEPEGAVARLWRVRSLCVGRARRADLQRTDRLLQRAILARGGAAWGPSTTAYARYLARFPSLHSQLAPILASRLQGGADRGVALDVFCGTGAVARELERLGTGRKILGVDGSPEMIAEARSWAAERGESVRPSFCHAAELEERVESASIRDVTINMGFFQVDPQERHFLFARLMPLLAPDCRIWLSTYSADFEFPDFVAREHPEINRTNGFKAELFRQWSGTVARDLQECTKPTWPKETVDSLRWFFEFHGFELAMDPADVEVVPVERSWADRVAFTRIPVIAKKVFGNVPAADLWEVLEEPDGYHDVAYGAVFAASRLRADHGPRLYSHVSVDCAAATRMRYAVAVIVRNASGNVLFVKRGTGARDHQGHWSLPSTEARPGLGLWESIKQSVGEHLAMAALDAPRILSARFATRGDAVLVMYVFEAVARDESVELSSSKYEELRWTEPSFVHELQPEQTGECTRSLRDAIREGLLRR